MTVDLIRNFPFFSIFLAMFAGIVSAPLKNGKLAGRLTLAMTTAVLVMSAVLLARLAATGEVITFQMGHFPAPWGNEIRAGVLEALMAVLFSVVMLLSVLGGYRDAFEDVLPEKQSKYFVMLDLLFGGMIALLYTNDVFTGYVFIEITMIAACSIIMAKDTSRSLVATMRYMIMMLLGSGLYLLGIIIMYVITGELLMVNIQQRIIRLVETGEYAIPFYVMSGLIVVGIAIKSAVFPFHTMLPGAHSVATPTSSALLSGLVLKAYIFLLIKFITRVFTVDVLNRFGITNVLYVLGAAGMICCSIMALRESDLKRMIAYSSSAQIGYIFLGLGMAQFGGLAAACLQIIAHALTKSMIFICAGSLSASTDHNTDIRFLRGVGQRNRLAAVGFTVGALSLIGVPLLPGFAAKLYLATTAAASVPHLIITLTVLVASMVLNALYFVPAVIAIWSKKTTEDEKPHTPHPVSVCFRISVCASLVLNLFVGTCFQPIMALIQQGLSVL